jgi:hypothetical protein
MVGTFFLRWFVRPLIAPSHSFMVAGIHVGGCNDRIEFFISGHVLDQVSECEKEAQPGEVFLSNIACSLVKERIVAKQRGQHFKLEKVNICWHAYLLVDVACSVCSFFFLFFCFSFVSGRSWCTYN